MLDKSVPYVELIMRRDQGTPIPEYLLPEGFTYSLYRPGDEKDWAKIETSVLEFDSELEAYLYYQERFLPYADELRRRCMFIENPDGVKIATATAYWEYSGVRRDPWLHWVSVMPEYQGLGLGKAIVSKVTRLMLEIEGDRNFYLHTQTWSHTAIFIYEKIGYRITDQQDLCYSNEGYREGTSILEGLRRK